MRQHKELTDRDRILYILEKQKLYPIMHSKLLERLPRRISSAMLIAELVQLEMEGFLVRRIDDGSNIYGRKKYRPTLIYTLSELYLKQDTFQIPSFLETLYDL